MVNREAPPSEQLREPMVNSGEGQEKKAEAVADLLRSTSKIGRNADAVRLRIRDAGSIPMARSIDLVDSVALVPQRVQCTRTVGSDTIQPYR